MRRPLKLAIVAAAVVGALLTAVCTVAAVAANRDPEGQFWDALPVHHDYLWAEVLVTLNPYLANHPTRNFQDRSPLFWACWEGDPRVAQFLVRHGARVDYADHNGTTCLHAAAHHRCDPQAAADIAELLLEWGADPLAQDAQGRTPLRVAEEVGNSTVATLLREEHP